MISMVALKTKEEQAKVWGVELTKDPRGEWHGKAPYILQIHESSFKTQKEVSISYNNLRHSDPETIVVKLKIRANVCKVGKNETVIINPAQDSGRYPTEVVGNYEVYFTEKGTFKKRWETLLVQRSEMSLGGKEFNKIRLEGELNEFLQTGQGNKWLEGERCSKKEKKLISEIRAEDRFKHLMRR